MGTRKQLMVVQHFSVETDFHMSKNMRFEGIKEISTQIVVLFGPYYEGISVFMQVEFNKAAQSLTDAMIPTNQKKSALNRLVKVGWLSMIFLV